MTDKEQIIVDGVDVMECDYYYVDQETDQVKCDEFGGHCREHKNCYFKQLARKTQECEDLKEKNALLESQMAFNLTEIGIRLGNEVNRSETLLKELKRLDKIKDEYREMSENLKAEEKFLKQCCTKAGEELAKHSFDYDGKEKNLVVQAMELNEKYEKLSILAQEESAKNAIIEYELNDKLKQKMQECDKLEKENKVLQKIISELEYSAQVAIELNDRYHKALEEIEEIVNEAYTDSQSVCKSCNFSCEHKDILDIISKAKEAA